ncbi:hypothetical protein V8E54_006170 [Elaphomyces granulatus]
MPPKPSARQPERKSHRALKLPPELQPDEGPPAKRRCRQSDSTKKAVPMPSESLSVPMSRDRSDISHQSGFTTQPEDDRVTLVATARDRASNYVPTGRGSDEANLTPCLHAFLEFLPEEGVVSVARACQNDDDLYKVFNNLCTALLYPMKALRRAKITSSPHPKRQLQRDLVAGLLPSPSPRTQTLRRDCLLRDDHRCVVSRHLETNEWKVRGRPENEDHGHLEVAHIIPYAYANYENTSTPPKGPSESWGVLWRCFPALRRIGMNPDHINDPSNALSLLASLHKEFGDFKLAFEATDTPHVYRIKTYRDIASVARFLLPADSIVEFRAAAAEATPLPEPNLLSMHHALAEVLNASGMGETVDRYLRDLEELKCLAEDGSTQSALVSVGLAVKVFG